MNKKYIDTQKYCDCQLVSLINALIFFDKEIPGKERYEKLVDDTYCRHGGIIGIDIAYKELGLIWEKAKFDIRWIRKNLPIELSVWHKKVGWHSVLIADVKGDRVRVANFTGPKWWIWKDFKKYVPNKWCGWRIRSIKLEKVEG